MSRRSDTRKVVRKYLELTKDLKDFDISNFDHLGKLLYGLEKKGYDSETGEQRKILHLEIIKDEYERLHPDRRKYIIPE